MKRAALPAAGLICADAAEMVSARASWLAVCHDTAAG